MEFPPDCTIPRYQRGLLLGFNLDKGFSGRGFLSEARKVLQPGGYEERFRDSSALHPETWAFVAEYYAAAQFNKADKHFDADLLERLMTDPRCAPKTRTLAAEALVRHFSEQTANRQIHADQIRALISRLGGLLQSLSIATPV